MPVHRLLVPPLVAAAVAAGLAAPASAAKSRHAPCPTTGTTLLKNTSSSLLGWRVSRVGATMRLCTRVPGRRRHVVSLGPWTPATRLSDGYSEIAWTTRTTAVDGTTSDTIRTVELATRKRRLTIANAAVAPNATTPATKDTVLRLVADSLAIAWVTSGGRLAVHVDRPALVPTPETGPPPFRTGSLYAVTDVGRANAAALAAGVQVLDDSESDPCGGIFSRYLAYPAAGPFPAGQFRFYQEEAKPGPGC